MIRLKTTEEIETLKIGGERHALILKKLEAMVAPGLSTFKLEEEARRLIAEYGDKASFLGYRPDGANRDFPAALCVSINEEIVHGIPNEKERFLQEGDIVTLDLGITHNGLITDSAITVPVGKVSEEVQKLLKVTKEALNRGIEQAKPGNHVGDIGFAISKVVSASGFSIARGLAGHGVGYDVHEDPFVPNYGNPGEGDELVPGLVIAIEPMVSIGKSAIKVLNDGYTIRTGDGSLSAHFEHTVAITPKGNIVLTAYRD